MCLDSGLFISALVVGHAAFLNIIGDWKNFMFWNEKFPRFGHPYNLFKYFQNKVTGSNKTLQKRQYRNGSIKEQPFLSRGSNELYTSHQEKKEGTNMWNAWVLLDFTLLHALKFIIEIEDNGMACDYYVTKVGAVLSIRNAFQALYCHKEFHDILYGDPMSASVYFFIFCTEHHKKIKI